MSIKKILILVLLTVFFTECGSNTNTLSSKSDKSNIIKYSNNLSINDYPGYSIVKIRNPWDTIRTLAQYVLVDSGVTLPKDIDVKQFTPIQVPLKNSLVFSNIHCSLIQELGKGTSIGGIIDSEFITNPEIQERIENGSIQNCGTISAPDIERIMQLRPDAILLSPYNNNSWHDKLQILGIPLVETADYLEKTPLGRAEWMKFYGRLYGKGESADSMFMNVEREYNALKESVKGVKSRPKVIVDGVYGQVWSVPTAGSVTGAFLTDAGAVNPFNDLSDSGSAQLSPEKVLFKGADADIWLIRYFKDGEMTLSDWGKENKNYSQFKAFKSGMVFGSNTKFSGAFDDAAFHPQWILADLISIFHPELNVGNKHVIYYHTLK